MLKVVVENVGAFYQHYPRAATIVTANYDGRRNAMAVAWHSSISFSPPFYGIAVASKRYTYHMISESKQFGINFMPFDKSETIAAVGGSSGNLIDKFTEFNMNEDRPIKTETPILKDAYAAYECIVINNTIFGDHAWIIGEIVAVHIDESLFKQDGTLDLSTVRPALYLGNETYCSTDGESVKYLDRNKYGLRG